MDKKLIEKELNDIEKQIKKLLKNSSIKFSKEDDGKMILENIRKHIIDIGEVKDLFDKYEKLAKSLQNFEDDGDDEQIVNMTECMKKLNVVSKEIKVKKVSNIEKSNQNKSSNKEKEKI